MCMYLCVICPCCKDIQIRNSIFHCLVYSKSVALISSPPFTLDFEVKVEEEMELGCRWLDHTGLSTKECFLGMIWKSLALDVAYKFRNVFDF